MTAPTLETTDPTTGATTTGCTPTENAQGSYTLPNCSIVGGVGDSVLFNFESNTGLVVNSASFTIPATTSSSSSGYTCPSGGQLSAADTSCAESSSATASYVQTSTTPVYANVQTGSTSVYTYEQTGTTLNYGYTCPNRGQLGASGVTCVKASSYRATYSTVSDTTVWHHGVNPNPNAFRTSGW